MLVKKNTILIKTELFPVSSSSRFTKSLKVSSVQDAKGKGGNKNTLS